MRSSAIPIAIVVGGIIIAGTVYLSAPKTSPLYDGDPSLVRPVSTADHIFGNPAARVFIIEYADFNCEYCRGFHDTLHQIVANEGADGEVAWIFRHFPLAEPPSDAFSLARAAECAAEVGGNEAFWEFSTLLYKNQPVAPADIGAIAAAAKLPSETFATCYASESASAPLVERVMRDRQNALDMGAQGTPFSIILATGQSPVVVAAAYSYDAVKSLVDQALLQSP